MPKNTESNEENLSNKVDETFGKMGEIIDNELSNTSSEDIISEETPVDTAETDVVETTEETVDTPEVVEETPEATEEVETTEVVEEVVETVVTPEVVEEVVETPEVTETVVEPGTVVVETSEVIETPEETITPEGSVLEPTVVETPPVEVVEGEIPERVRELIRNENNFNYLACGRLLKNGDYTIEDLKEFYGEYDKMGALSSADHYELIGLLKVLFPVVETEEESAE